MIGQAAVALCALLLLAFAPPVAGSFLLVPLTQGAAAGLAALAIERGGAITGMGPLPGSLIVVGDRATLASAMLNRGVLPLAAPSLLCREPGETEGLRS